MIDKVFFRAPCSDPGSCVQPLPDASQTTLSEMFWQLSLPELFWGTEGGKAMVIRMPSEPVMDCRPYPKPSSYDIRGYFGKADIRGTRVKGVKSASRVRGASGVKGVKGVQGVSGVKRVKKSGNKNKKFWQTSVHRYFCPKEDPKMAWYVDRMAQIQEYLELPSEFAADGYDSDVTVTTQQLESSFYVHRSIFAMRDHWQRQMTELRMASRVSQEPQLREMLVFRDLNWSRPLLDHPDVRSPWLRHVTPVVRCRRGHRG